MKKKSIRILLCIILGVIFLAFLYLNGEARYQSPFQREYEFGSVSQAVRGGDGNTYVIDGGRKNVIVLNQDNRLVRKINGGSESRDFFYAGRVCADQDGTIYVADTISGQQGNLVQEERVLQIKNTESNIVYEHVYTQEEQAPLQYGNIVDLQCSGGFLYFLEKGSDSLILRRWSSEGGIEDIQELHHQFYISDAAYDASTQNIYVTTRTGEVYGYSETAGWEKLREADGESIPWGITAAGGQVYYTELHNRRVYHFTQKAPLQHELCYQGDRVLYALNLSVDGEVLSISDNTAFLTLDTVDYSAYAYDRVALGNRVRVVLFWVFSALFTVVEVLIAGSVILGAIRDMKDKSSLARVGLVVISSIAVAALASYSSMSVLLSDHDQNVQNHMQMFAGNLIGQVDTDILEGLNSVDDYHNADYMTLKNRLDSMIEAGYDNNVYYYYVIYKTDGRNINCIMDYEDTTACGQPIYTYGDNEYSQVLDTGEAYTVSEISSYGAWTFTLLPVRNQAGEVIAELEVGASLDKEVLERKALIRENIITVLCSCGVIVMLVLEGVFALSFFEKRRKTPKAEWDITQQMPIRIMVFLAYMTDSMQDAFIAILCSRLYTDNLPLSRELAIALPMSLQLMMAAAFSMFGGRLAVRLGARRTMQTGLISQLAGFLICMLVPGYMGILAGKALIGCGLGIIYVTANTMASMGSTDEYVEKGFADVSAGVLSGVTIGVGLGSIVLSFADYRMVYLVGAIFMGIGILFTLRAENVRMEETQDGPKDKLRIVKFLFSRRVLAFFALILVPFMMSLSYREYFFPLYVEQFGITEVQIGRIYLGCGVLVLYFGPFLSRTILKYLGARKSIMLASLCMAGNMGLFVLIPNIYSVLVGMVILSVIISFAYTCQYTYFEGLEECEEVGMGNAMGIYSMFENVGQTLGPIVYGSVLMLGNRRGIMVLFLAMAILVAAFVLIGGARGKGKRRGKEA